jgi:hypothetical protein
MFCLGAVVLLAQQWEIPDTNQAQVDFVPDTGPGAATYAAREREIMFVRGQINTFFSSGTMRDYEDLYGTTTRLCEDWSRLTPTQQANRGAVCNRAQEILDDAVLAGVQMNVAQALWKGHSEVLASLTPGRTP